MGDLVYLPRTARARAAVMAGFDPRDAVARKLFQIPGDYNDPVPPGGGLPGGAGPGGRPDVAASRRIPQTAQAWQGLVASGHVLSPPYDPWHLVGAVEESSDLRSSIEAYATNLGGFGIELEPLFPTTDDDGNPIDPPPEAEEQRHRVQLFLAACNLDLEGWGGVQWCVDYDTETVGNGYMEVLRGLDGQPAAVEHLPGYTMRLGPESSPVLTEVPFVDPATGQLITLLRYRRFRAFVQVRDGITRYFKSWGDPRFLNWRTGQYSEIPWPVDPRLGDLNATEVLHFKVYCPYSDYGVPRWIGAQQHSSAATSAAKLINDWFDKAPIGLKLAIVSGGTFAPDSIKKALGQINAHVRGRDAAWTIAEIAATTDARDPIDDTREQPPRVLFEDAAFEVPEALYRGEDSLIDKGAERAARPFRLPPVYYGRAQDHTRASVNGARATAEEQIFVPLRARRWASRLNNQLLPTMGVNLWRARYRGANTTDDTEAAKSLAPFVQGGGASPNTLIKLLSELSGLELDRIPEPWGDRPMALTELLLGRGLDPNRPLAELAAEVAAAEEQAREEARAQLEAVRQDSGGPGGAEVDPKGDKGATARKLKAAAALDTVASLMTIRRELEQALTVQDLTSLDPAHGDDLDPGWYG